VDRSSQDRVKQVLNAQQHSCDKQKRAIALQILADLELFVMFCYIVEQQNKRSKNNSKKVVDIV
jgi:hypothetical protein